MLCKTVCQQSSCFLCFCERLEMWYFTPKGHTNTNCDVSNLKIWMKSEIVLNDVYEHYIIFVLNLINFVIKTSCNCKGDSEYQGT